VKRLSVLMLKQDVCDALDVLWDICAAERCIDAVLGFPPDPVQHLLARHDLAPNLESRLGSLRARCTN